MDNIIFLDIDGVLTTRNSKTSVVHENLAFNDISVQTLKYIIKQYNAKIVLSSDWRLHKSLEQLKKLFSHYYLDEFLIDKTPYFPDESRDKEIQYWLNHNQYHNFIIIDDMPNMNELNEHLVVIDSKEGLNMKYVSLINEKFKIA